MDKTQQGDIGVAAATLHYRLSGAKIMLPLTTRIKYDLIIDRGKGLERVQVKTTDYKPNGPYAVQLRTTGANYTTESKNTKITNGCADIVFILCMNGFCYELPVSVISGMSEITLGKKYSNYIVREGWFK